MDIFFLRNLIESTSNPTEFLNAKQQIFEESKLINEVVAEHPNVFKNIDKLSRTEGQTRIKWFTDKRKEIKNRHLVQQMQTITSRINYINGWVDSHPDSSFHANFATGSKLDYVRRACAVFTRNTSIRGLDVNQVIDYYNDISNVIQKVDEAERKAAAQLKPKELKVNRLTDSLYHAPEYGLLIKVEGCLQKCVGTFHQETNERGPLTPKAIETCKSLGLKYEVPEPACTSSSQGVCTSSCSTSTASEPEVDMNVAEPVSTITQTEDASILGFVTIEDIKDE